MKALGIGLTAVALLLAVANLAAAVRKRRPQEELMVVTPWLAVLGFLAFGAGDGRTAVTCIYIGCWVASALTGAVHVRLMWPSYWGAPVGALLGVLVGGALVFFR